MHVHHFREHVFSFKRPISLCFSASNYCTEQFCTVLLTVQNLEILSLEVVGKHCASNDCPVHHMA